MKTFMAFIALTLAAGAGAKEKIPLYTFLGATPFRTVDALADDAYMPGDLAAVAGYYQVGGTTGGAVLACVVNDPYADDANVLATAPVDVRYFYLDVLPPGAPADPGEWARATGLVADEGLYGYGYVLRPQALEALTPPAVNEDAVRDTLVAIRKQIKKVKLDAITGEPHWQYNKGYKIVADAAAAECEIENVDYDRNLAVVRVRLERLPPVDSDILFRYLDVYVVVDAATSVPAWAVACVGGFYLE